MGLIITTPLDPARTAKRESFNLTLSADSDISGSCREKISDIAEKSLIEVRQAFPQLTPEQITGISEEGVHTDIGTIRSKKTIKLWKQLCEALEKGKAAPPHIPVSRTNEPEPPLVLPDLAKVDFEFVPEDHYLDGIRYPRPDRLLGESDEAFIHRCVKMQSGMEKQNCVSKALCKPRRKYNQKSGKIRSSTIGVSESIIPRKNYRMTVRPEGRLAAFLGRSEPFTSTEVLAKNGLADRSVNSSFNRYTPDVSLMRATEAEDGSIDCLSGRAFDLHTAHQMAEFAFLSQLNLYNNPATRHLAQGIEVDADGQFIFEFAVQSVFSTRGGELEMLEKEEAAYKELARRPLLIQNPDNPASAYQVRIRSLPVVATQINHAMRFEQLLPASLSGEYASRDREEAFDQMLLERALDKADSLTPEQWFQINDTFHFLESGQLNNWQRVMARAFICHILKIPVINHCKSCVDRTNIVNAIHTAMKQWLRAGMEIPKENGRWAIFRLPEVTFDGIEPFKELFAYALHKGLKISEFSRAEKGYKYFFGVGQSPTLHDLLPRRYLIPGQQPLPIVSAALKIVAFALLTIASPFLFFYSLTINRKRRCWRALDVFTLPFKFVWRWDLLSPRVLVDDAFRDVGGRSLLHQGDRKKFGLAARLLGAALPHG